jgi:hypothetical protein
MNASRRRWSPPTLVNVPFLLTEKCRNSAMEMTTVIPTGTYLHCDQDGQTSNKILSGETGTWGPS